MKEEAYFNKMKELTEKHQKDRNKLMTEFAKKNSPCVIGDIIEDSCVKIKVEKIGVSVFWNAPSCHYIGPLLTLKNVPYKNNKRGSIAQSRIIRINGVDHKEK